MKALRRGVLFALCAALFVAPAGCLGGESAAPTATPVPTVATPIPTPTPRPNLTREEAIGIIRFQTTSVRGGLPGESVGRFLERDAELNGACTSVSAQAPELGTWSRVWSARFIVPQKWVVWVTCQPAVVQTRIAEGTIPDVVGLEPNAADEAVSDIVSGALAAWSVDDVTRDVLPLNDNAAALMP